MSHIELNMSVLCNKKKKRHMKQQTEMDCLGGKIKTTFISALLFGTQLRLLYNDPSVKPLSTLQLIR